MKKNEWVCVVYSKLNALDVCNRTRDLKRNSILNVNDAKNSRNAVKIMPFN